MERNLDNIFDRFYPRSQTVKQGIFLLKAAWAVDFTCDYRMFIWNYTNVEVPRSRLSSY